MLWRPLPEGAPASAVLIGRARVELMYPDRREIRAWPSFELLSAAPAAPAGPAGGGAAQRDLAAQVTGAPGGSVSAMSAGPSAGTAALWTDEPYPPWYRVVISSGAGQVMTTHRRRPALVADGRARRRGV